MRKKSSFTMVEQAIVLVPEFEKVAGKLEQQVTLRGQSGSRLNNHIRRITLFVVHFGKLPEQIDPEEINEYLAALARDPRSPSRSSFKHSWGRNLSLHPHIDCLVPAAGYTLDGKWKNIGHSGTYPYPVHQLSSAFKGKFLDSLKRALRKQNELSLFNKQIQQAYQTKWVVYCEPSPASAEHVVKYLGQYTHRVAITNQRILNIAGGKVTFAAKDYRDRAAKKPVTLDGIEFLRRFTLHILPKRFVKIRRFGIYNHTVKRDLKLQFTPEEKPGIDTLIKKQQPTETNVERFARLTGINPCLCPVCKTGRMVTIRELPRIRSPARGSFYKPTACS